MNIPAKIYFKTFLSKVTALEYEFESYLKFSDAIKWSFKNHPDEEIRNLYDGTTLDVHVMRLGANTWIRIDVNNFKLKPYDKIHIACLPQGSSRFRQGAIATLKGAAQGASLGGVIGSFVPIPGVGTAVGAAIGGVIGGAIGFVSNYLTQRQTDVNNSFKSNALQLINEVQRLSSVQPIRITPNRKRESKELSQILLDKRVNPGNVVPEVFGTLRVKPNALTPFFLVDTDKKIRRRTGWHYRTDYEYSIIYSVTEGSADIEKRNFKFAKKLVSEVESPREIDFDAQIIDGENISDLEIAGFKRDLSAFQNFMNLFSISGDSNGKKISGSFNLGDESSAKGQSIELNLRLSSTSYPINLVNEAETLGENWVYNYYKKQTETETTEANSMEPDTSGFFHYYIRS